MSAGAELEGFVYAEYLEGPQQRSLGFRLLVPEVPQPWSAEVETLARRLQAAPYPDHWPITDLFCSVLLSQGQRLIALARYGLEDRTPSRRRGGIELIGVIAPNSVGVHSALSVYQWLRHRRSGVEDVRVLGGKYDLVEVLAEAPATPTFGESVPVLPVRLWQDGALLFAAAQSSDPDLRLGMLEHTVSEKWQWLPLTGTDFPIATFAQRGPLVAWTPHLTGVAVKLDQSGPPVPVISVPRRVSWFTPLLVLVAIALMVANLWVSMDIRFTQAKTTPLFQPSQEIPKTIVLPSGVPPETDIEAAAQQLYRYLLDRGLFRELRESQLLQNYEKLNRKNDFFTVKTNEAKMALGAVVELASRKSPTQVEAIIRSTNQLGKGIDEDVINLIAQRVYQKLTE